MDASRARKIFIAVAISTVIVTATLAFLLPYSADPASKAVWYKRVPGFAAMLGLAGCLVMVPLVKTLAKKVLQRPEDYYAHLESRLRATAEQPPGASLADPSAPSETEDGETPRDTEPEETAAAASAREGGSHG